jgi:DNA-binding response OmpR family regulator
MARDTQAKTETSGMERQPHQSPILVVEDDRNILALVVQYLENAGFATVSATDGPTGLQLARRHSPAFVILDLNLPGLDGTEVCRELRKTSNVPILMLTARADEVDRVVGFSLGADDYVVKPFSPRELVERVKAILRRTRPAAETAALRHGALVLDPEKRKVVHDGSEVALTPSEYKLLHALLARPGRAFTRDELLGRLYERGETVVDRVVDVHIGKLRQKIEPDPSRPRYIETVHGVGYRFAEPGPD